MALSVADKQAAIALRDSLLRDLWSTYAITPLTQPDVASLLAVLANIVGEPTFVSAQSATGAIDFAATVLH